jgi:hypothetical protein
MALTLDPLRDLLDDNPPPSELPLRESSLDMKSIGRQPSFAHLSEDCLIAKGGIPVASFKPLDLDCDTRLSIQSSYYRLLRHAQSAPINISATSAAPSGSIVPFAAGRSAWVRSLQDLHAARWREIGYDPDEEPVGRRLLGSCPDPMVALVLGGGSIAGCGSREASRVVLELRRLRDQCTDPDDVRVIQAALDTVRAESRSGLATTWADDERAALAAAERRFHKGIRQLQQNWTNIRKPSEALLAMRGTAERMMTEGTDSIIAAKKAEEIEEGYRAALEALRSRYEAEKEAVRTAFMERRNPPARQQTPGFTEVTRSGAARPSSSTVQHSRTAGTRRVVARHASGESRS